MSRNKLLLTIAIALIISGTAFAQSITNYAFTTASGTFTELTGATAPALSGGSLDDGWYNSIPIGFDFWYMGVKYTTVSATTSGWLTFNQTLSSAGITNNLTSGTPRPVIAPLWDDLDEEVGDFSYKTEGLPGSRVFTAEWKNYQWNYSATGATISFQAKLYEATGVIEFIYRDDGGTVNSASASIGITAVGTGAGNYLSLDGPGASPIAMSTAESTRINIKPATGTIYTFTPPAAPPTPTGLVFSGVTISAMTLEWGDVAGEAGYGIYRSTDGINYSFVANNVANDTDYTATGLSLGTLYYWQIYAFAELGSGALSDTCRTLWGTVFGTKWIISGVTATDTYPSFTAAITDLNTNLVGPGGVTFNIDGGQTFTEDVPALTASGAASAPIVFQKKPGTDASVLVIPASFGTKTTSTIGYDGDAVIKIAGGDYITFDGIDVQDVAGASTDAQRYEYGYLLVKASVTDACKNVTIKNANISLYKLTGYSAGICVSNSDNAGNNNIAVTSDGGRSEYIYIYNNIISNVYHGIVTRGHSTYYDRYIEVGDLGGNTISNYGGGTLATYGFYCIYGTNFKVNNNFFNGGAGNTAIVRAIYTSIGTNSNIDINNNDITLASSGTTAGITGIENTWTGTINIIDNVIHDINYATATTGAFYGINNASGASPLVNIIHNTVRNYTATGAITSGTFYGIYHTGAVTVNMNMNIVRNNTIGGTGAMYLLYCAGSPTGLISIASNQIYDNTKTGASGSIYCIYNTGSSTALATVTQNQVFNNTIPTTSGATASYIYGYYNLSSPSENILDNNIYGLTIAGAGTSTSTLVYGIYTYTAATSVKNIYRNNVYTLSSHIGTTQGIRTQAGRTVYVGNNKVYNLNNGGAAGTTYGIYLLSAKYTEVYNNFIYDIKAPISSGANQIAGIYSASSTSGDTVACYFNSIYLNAAAGGANFGSSGIYANTTPLLDLRNNIVMNSSVANGTGLAAALRFSSTTLTNYAATSNNNDFFAPVIFYDGTNTDVSMTTYQARVAPRDNKSFSADPKFLSYADAIDLHLDPNFMVCNRKGTPVTLPFAIVDDIDNESRHPTTPDIGADEYTPTVTPGAVTLISPTPWQQLVPQSGLLLWHADPNSDHYTVMLGSTNPPPEYAYGKDTFALYSGLLTATKYYWQVKSWNDTTDAGGPTPSALDSFFTVTPPNPPSNLTLSNITSSSMKLDWKDNSSDEDSFFVYKSTDGIVYNRETQFGAGNYDTTYTASGLSVNTRYWWKVTAWNANGESEGSLANDWTLAEVPGQPTLSNPTQTSINVVINPATNPSATQFAVRVDDGTDVAKFVNYTTGKLQASEDWGTYAQWGSTTGKTVTGLSPGVSYTFDVKARNANSIETGYGTSAALSTIAPLAIPFGPESFTATTFPPTYWSVYNFNGSNTWVRYTTYYNTSPASARCQYDLSPYAPNNDWLVTPNIGPVQLYDSLVFYYRGYSASYYDTLTVRISTNPDVTDTSAFTVIDHILANTATFTRKAYSLDAYNGQKIYVAFWYHNNDEWYVYVDDIQITRVFANDMATISVDGVPAIMPVSTTDYTQTIKATVKNNGTSSTSSVPVKLRITGPSAYLYEDLDQTTLTTLTQGQTEQITFSPDWTVPTVPGIYTIKVWTELAGDENSANDTFTYNVNVYSGIWESFSGYLFPPLYWTVKNFYTTTIDDAWSRYTTYYYSGPACARCNYDLPNNDWLITPRVLRDGVNPDSLIFWYRNGSTSYTETLAIRVSTSPNQTDTSLYTIIGRVISTDINWVRYAFDLSTYSDTLYVAFHYPAYNKLSVAIDDVQLPGRKILYTDAEVSSVVRPNDNETKRFGFFPKVTVTNNSEGTRDIPVTAEIRQYTAAYEDIYSGLKPDKPYKAGDALNAPRLLVSPDAVSKEPVAPVSRYVDGDTMLYYDGINRSGVGYGGGTIYAAVRFTAPAPCSVKAITFYKYGSYVNSGYAYLHAAGTIDVPGAILESVPFTSGATGAWIRLDFSQAYRFPMGAQFWLSFSAVHTSGQYPCGADEGYNGLPYRSFVSLDGANWWPIAEAGVNRNWNIRAIGVFPSGSLVYTSSKTATGVGGADASVEVEFDDEFTCTTEGYYGIRAYTSLTGDYEVYNNDIYKAFSVDVIPLTLVAPGNGTFTNDSTPTFEWNSVAGATTYRLQVYDGTETMYIDTVVDGTTCTLEDEQYLTDGTYYWHVRVETPSPADPYSDAYTLTIDKVGPLPPNMTTATPADEDTIGGTVTPTFSWEIVSDAELYEVYCYDDSKAPVFTAQTDVNNLVAPVAMVEGYYHWQVRCQDAATNWGDWSSPISFYLDLTPPAAPVLTSPSGVVGTRKPTFLWESVADAALYNLIVSTAKDVVIDETLDVTTFTPVDNMDVATYTWTVKSCDIYGNWGVYASPSFEFTIQLFTPGWAMLESIPATDVPKAIKDGGALVGIPGSGKDATKLFAFLGTKTPRMYKYSVGTGWSYNPLDTILFGHKYKYGVGVDTIKYNKKYPGKGAAMCFDGDHTIYATKGNGTYEFWAYDLTTGLWTAKAFVPSQKGLKGGTSLCWYNGLVYLLAGGQKKDDQNNFFAYEPNGDTWTTLTGVTVGANTKPWKDGSSINELGGLIYAVKGGDKYNAFYAYDPNTGLWTEKEAIPLEDSLDHKWKTKLLVKDGAVCVNGDGVLYAMKGGATTGLWKYTPGDTGVWDRLDPIPIEKIDKKHRPKTGAAADYVDGAMYLLVGNKQLEFWRYVEPTGPVSVKPATITSAMIDKVISTHNFSFNATPNPFSKLTTIRYTVPVNGKVSVKLYNASGRLIETLVNDNLSAGTYSMNLSATKLAKGVYFVKYEDNTNKSEIKLIVQ